MTFLVNKKMHPALAARIEASVTGSKPVRGRPKPRTVAIVRIALFVAMAAFLYFVLTISSQRAQIRAPSPKPTFSSAK
jgi:hypothetical protein